MAGNLETLVRPTGQFSRADVVDNQAISAQGWLRKSETSSLLCLAREVLTIKHLPCLHKTWAQSPVPKHVLLEVKVTNECQDAVSASLLGKST